MRGGYGFPVLMKKNGKGEWIGLIQSCAMIFGSSRSIQVGLLRWILLLSLTLEF